MKLPCKNCLLLPRCRHKEYSPLFDECKPLADLMYKFGRSDSRYRKRDWNRHVLNLEKTLKPTRWTTSTLGKGYGSYVTITGIPLMEK